LVTVTLAQSATAAPSTPVVVAICAAEILGLAGFSIVPALLPQFIEAWSLTNTQARWLSGITSAGYMLAVIPLVSATDRRPAGQIYLASGAARFVRTSGSAREWLPFRFVYLPETVLVSSKDLPTSGTEIGCIPISASPCLCDFADPRRALTGGRRNEANLRFQLGSDAELFEGLRQEDTAGAAARWVDIGDRFGIE